MRSKVILGVLVLMLAGLVGALALRSKKPHSASIVPDATSSSQPQGSSQPNSSAASKSSASPRAATSNSAVAKTSASSSASSKASATGSTQPAANPTPKTASLGRPLRVVVSQWALAAPGIMANDGTKSGKGSLFAKRGQNVEIAIQENSAKLQNALARGGEDAAGADIALLPLHTFVASYESLRALNPVIFFVVGWSQGGVGTVLSVDGFEKLPRGKLGLYAPENDDRAFTALYALDLAGVALTRVERVEKKEAAHIWGVSRARAKKIVAADADRHLALTTGEATRLVPFVAVTTGSMAKKHTAILSDWATGWLEGESQVAGDASAAARRIAVEKGGPEPLTLLAELGGIQHASLSDNAIAAGLSGRSAVNLRNLFTTSWRIWRAAEVLTIPPTEPPVNGDVIASLVRNGGKLQLPPSNGAAEGTSKAANKPLLIHNVPRAAAGKLNQEQLIQTIGMMAGVFGRSPIRLTTYRRAGAKDSKLSKQLLEQATERFGLDASRLSNGKARPKPRVAATIEIMPVP